MPRLSLGLGDPFARIRPTEDGGPSLEIYTLRFRSESRPNVPLHHPSSGEAHETLYLIDVIPETSTKGTRETELTGEFTRIAC